MGTAAAGVVLVTQPTLVNPYTVEEVRAFLARGVFVPVFIGVRRADFAADNIVVARRGDLWEKYRDRLWMAYDGAEKQWREAVEGLARAESAMEVRIGDLRNRTLDVLEIVGAARAARGSRGCQGMARRGGAGDLVPLERGLCRPGEGAPQTGIHAARRR